MSKKCPADIHGSLVMMMSPGTSWLWNRLARVWPAAASELMWPGVPVLAWATIRPRASNRPLARSPASRTIGEKAIRCSALACSLTIPIRFDQRISSSIPSISIAPISVAFGLVRPGGGDAADIVHHRAPTWRQDDSGLALLDHRRAVQALAAGQAGAVVDRRRAGLGPERRLERPLRDAGRPRRHQGLLAAILGPLGGKTPAHHLDRHVRGIDAVLGEVGVLERAAHRLGVAAERGVIVEGDRDLVLLAEITQVGPDAEAHLVRRRARLGQGRLRLDGHLRDQAAHLFPVQRFQRAERAADQIEPYRRHQRAER